MESKHSIVLYKIKSFNKDLNKDGHDGYEELAYIKRKLDLLKIVNDFCTLHEGDKKILQDPMKKNSIVYFSDIEKNEDERTISFYIHSGKSGLAAGLYDVENLKKSYEQTSKDAPLLPFLAKFYIPKESQNAYLALQKIGNAGAKTILDDFFTPHYRDKVKLRLRILPLATTKMMENYLNSIITSVEIVFQQPSENIANFAKDFGSKEKNITLKIPFNTEKGQKRLNSIFKKSKINDTDVFVLNEELTGYNNHDVSHVKVTVEQEDKKRILKPNKHHHIEPNLQLYLPDNITINPKTGCPDRIILENFMDDTYNKYVLKK